MALELKCLSFLLVGIIASNCIAEDGHSLARRVQTGSQEQLRSSSTRLLSQLRLVGASRRVHADEMQLEDHRLPVEPLAIEGQYVDSQRVYIARPEVVAPLETLDGRSIACRTACQWAPADALRKRGKTVIQLFCDEDDCTRQASHAIARFLNLEAAHQEDIGAASALRAYYTRIAIVEQRLLVSDSQAMVDSERQKQTQLQESGISSGIDLTSFHRQRIALVDREYQLQAQDRQLQSLLAHIASYDYTAEDTVQEQLEVFEFALDCDAVKQYALAHRNDLKGWIYLYCQVNETSAPVFAKMLATSVGGWVLPLPTVTGLKALLCPPDYSRLAANMKRELATVVQTHRKWISQAIEEKCSKVKLAHQRVQNARQILDSWEQRIEQLDRLEQLGDGQPEQSAQARSEYLKATSEEIARRLDARLAEIDLAEAAGGIARRCCAGEPWFVTGHQW